MRSFSTMGVASVGSQRHLKEDEQVKRIEPSSQAVRQCENRFEIKAVATLSERIHCK